MSTPEAAVILGDEKRLIVDIGERIDRAATALASLGIGPGDAVAILMRNDFAFFEAMGGAARLGAYPVPINWHFTGPETRYIAENSDAKALVVHADLLEGVKDDLPPGLPVFVVPTHQAICAAYGLPPERTAVPAGETSWNDWLDGFQPLPPAETVLTGSMIYTSGTTGHPKGVRREIGSLQEYMEFVTGVAIALGFDQGPVRTVITGPMYHSAPNAYATIALRMEGFLILQSRFDAEELLALIEEHKISHLHMVPTMFVRLLKLPEEVRAKYDLSSLRYVIHGAAPCPPEVKRAMIDWWGRFIFEYYGATEMGFVTVISSEEWLERPSSVGRPQPEIFLKITDESGEELPAGAGNMGEIFCRNDKTNNFTYYGDAKKRQEIALGDYVTCGDQGWLDAEGFLHLAGRSSDMVISGGVNIYPAEIEAALHEIPGVLDCAVFGVPDAEFGEKLVAVIQADGNHDLGADVIREGLRGRIANFKIPGRIDFTDTLPREDSGKIFKLKIREAYL